MYSSLPNKCICTFNLASHKFRLDFINKMEFTQRYTKTRLLPSKFLSFDVNHYYWVSPKVPMLGHVSQLFIKGKNQLTSCQQHMENLQEKDKVRLWLPYARHHKPLLSKSRSSIQAIHKDRIFWKTLLKNKEMAFGNGVKNIQATGYNGASTVLDM